MIGLKLRYSAQVIKAKQIVDAGTLGDIYYVETVADRRRGNPGGSFIVKATAGLGASARHRRLRLGYRALSDGTPETCCGVWHYL